MIITEKNTCPVEKTSLLSETKFKIKASAKAFRALSSQIYSNEIAAPIRELATNAWDAHREAKRLDKPFIVHLPNPLEPYFSIRDYGFGMSEQAINTIYTTYFESTKEGSNDDIGCLGLGSKSPFCYRGCESFTVTSYWRENPNSVNGMKYVYSAYLENGEPKLGKLAEEETTEPSGLEVVFFVKSDDFSKFYDNARDVYSKFKERPVVTGYSDWKIEDRSYSLQGTGWRMYKSTDKHYCNTTSAAIMGNISYSLYKCLHDYSNFNDVARTILSCGVELDFNIGDLEITLSREELQYDERTVKNINDRLSIALNEIESMIKSDLAACKTYWEACCLYTEICGFDSKYPQNLRNIINKLTIDWKGKTLTNSHGLYYAKDSIGEVTSERFFYGLPSGNRGSVKRVRSQKSTSINCEARVKFFELDNKEKSNSKVRHYVNNNTEEVIHLMDFSQSTVVDARDKFISLIGINESDFVKVSTLPVPPKKPRVKSSSGTQDRSLRTVLKFSNSGYTYRPRNMWTDESVEWKNKSNTYYYITVKHNEPHDRKYNVVGLKDLYNFAVKTLGFSEPLYGVIECRASKIKSMSNWVDFDTHINELFKDYVKTNNTLTLAEEHQKFNDFNSNMNSTLKSIINGLTDDSKYSKHEIIKEYKSLKKSSEEFLKVDNQLTESVIQYFNINQKTSTESVKLIREFINKYPMIKVLQESAHYGSGIINNIKFIKDYINLVDKV